MLTRLVPTEIRALGITFARADRESLLYILAFVVGYFLVAFMIYAASDFLAWRNLLRDRRRNNLRQDLEEQMLEDLSATTKLTSEQESQQARIIIEKRLREEEAWVEGYSRWFRLTGPVSFLRGLFEFGLPVLYGIFAMVLLLFVGLPPADGEATLEFMRSHSA